MMPKLLKLVSSLTTAFTVWALSIQCLDLEKYGFTFEIKLCSHKIDMNELLVSIYR